MIGLVVLVKVSCENVHARAYTPDEALRGESLTPLSPTARPTAFTLRYPAAHLISALFTALDALHAGLSAEERQGIRAFSIFDDQLEQAGPSRWQAAASQLRIAPVDQAQAALSSLDYASGLSPHEQLARSGFFLQPDFVRRIENVSNADQSLRVGPSELCLALLTGRVGTEAAEVSPSFHTKYGIRSCVAMPALPALWAQLISAHVGRSAWTAMTFTDDKYDLMIVPSDAALPVAPEHGWNALPRPRMPLPEALVSMLPGRCLPEQLIVRRFDGNGAARRKLCAQFANANWTTFAMLSQATPIGGTIGMDAKSFIIHAADDAAEIRHYENGVRVDVISDMRAAIRLLVEGQAYQMFSSMASLSLQAAQLIPSNRPPWPQELIIVGAAATPEIYAHVLDCNVVCPPLNAAVAAFATTMSTGRAPIASGFDEAAFRGAVLFTRAALQEPVPSEGIFHAGGAWRRIERDTHIHSIYLAFWEESERLRRSTSPQPALAF